MKSLRCPWQYVLGWWISSSDPSFSSFDKWSATILRSSVAQFCFEWSFVIFNWQLSWHIKSSHQLVIFSSNQSLVFEKLLTGCWFGLVTFIHYVDKHLDNSLYYGVNDNFSSPPVHVNRNMTMKLNSVNCSLYNQVPFLLSAQSVDCSTDCEMTPWESL